MKVRLTLLTLFILGLTVPAAGQAAKIEGYVSTDKGARVAGVRIVVTPGGQSGATDSKGHFMIKLPDNVQPGQAAQIRIDRAGWVIFNPMFGKCETKSVERNYEPLLVVIVPKGSPLALSPQRLSTVIAKWAAERVKLRAEVGKLKQELDEYDFLREYAAEYGFTLDQFRAAAEQWAQIKDSDDKEERALKEYWQKNYGRAAQLAEESAQVADEELQQANKSRVEASLKVIRRHKLAGNAYYADYKFNEALAAYSEIERGFETRKLSKEDFTEEWARVKRLIGSTKAQLGIRVEGAVVPHLLAEALDAYRQAETFYTRAQLPQDWATTQNHLGVVLNVLGERAEGDEGIRYLNEAAAAFRAALEVRTRAQLPQDWAETQSNLGNVLSALGARAEGDKGTKYLNEAVAAYRAALEVRTRAQFPQDWAATQNNLGGVLSELGERAEGSENIRYLNEAVASFRAALEVHTRAQLPQHWAATQNNLGVVLRDLGERAEGDEGIRYLNEAVAVYRAALEVYTRAQLPQQWAMTQNNLGVVLVALGARAEGSESAGYLNEAVASFRAALEVRTRAQLPQDWAETQSNLGNVLSVLGELAERDKGTKYLNEAVMAYRAALEVYTRTQLPQDWATTQSNLGNALRALGAQAGGSESIRYLNEAAVAYRAALEVRTRVQFPQDWAITQNNLGIVLNELGERAEGSESTRYLNEAAAAYRAALEVHTRAQLPQQWATTQSNLGSVLGALGERAEGSESIRYLKESAATFRATLEVRTRAQLPQHWAATQNNLGVALRDLGKRVEGDEGTRYLNEAVAAFRAALEVYTRAELPQDWARTQDNLAFTYVLLKDWAGAGEAYANVLQVSPDNAIAYRKAALIYQKILFKFDQAFALQQQWLARHKGDTIDHANFGEMYLTTARFSECMQLIPTLLAQPEVSDSSKTILRGIEIACLLALRQSEEASSKLDALIADVVRQPPAFKVEWSFGGTRYFISHNEKLSTSRVWLEQFLEALASKDRDTMLRALQEVRRTFKELFASSVTLAQGTSAVSKTELADSVTLAQRTSPVSKTELAEITERGKQLAEYDVAAWYATDAVFALKPAEGSIARYIAKKTNNKWTVIFGRFNEQRDRFLVVYEANQGEQTKEFDVKKYDVPKEDTGFYLSAAKAIETALADFRGERRPYNVAVLPTTTNQMYVYVIPAQTKLNVYPLGGDVRYLISSDGSKIVEKRQLHKAILEFEASENTDGGFHVAVLDNIPEDTDVFHVLSRKPSFPQWIVTSKYVYRIEADGTINYVMTREAFMKTRGQ